MIRFCQQYRLASKELVVGDVVRIETAFTTADENMQILLKEGTTGIVESVDCDGDAQVRFPFLAGVPCSLRWVLQKHSGTMSACRISTGHLEATPQSYLTSSASMSEAAIRPPS